MKGKILLIVIIFLKGYLFITNASGVLFTIPPVSSGLSDTSYSITVIPYHDSLERLKALNPAYGLSFYKKGVIYMQSTKKEEGVLSDYASFGRLDTYYVPLKNFEPGIPEFFMPNKPFPYPPGTFSFTADQKTFFFSKPINAGSGKQVFSIYKVERDPNDISWIESSFPLTFCDNEHSFMHPAISGDGKFMIFVSDIPAGQGGKNLFKSVLNSTGWSKPTSLGKRINSNADELFPCLDKFNNLYFASNRADSTGFDIYFSRFNGKGFETPVRMKNEINSRVDDLIFRVDSDNSLAFLIAFDHSGDARLRFFVYNLSQQTTKESPPEKKIKKQQKVKPGPVLSSEKKAKPTPAPKPAKKETYVPPSPPAAPVAVQSKPEATSPAVIFRVQILSSMKKKDLVITINNKKYKAWYYYYKGAYRYTIGQFTSVTEAIRFKNICTKNGYPQAFVAAFKGKERITDPKVFRH